MTYRILILGGTAEARKLAEKLAKHSDYEIVLSLAGRTKQPIAQPVPTRTGGFGGSEGLATYLKEQRIDLLIDTTHPYAANISRNAIAAADKAGVKRILFQRPEWKPQEFEKWQVVPTVTDAVSVLGLGITPLNVFLALGRQELLPFEVAPQHHYLIRSVDPVMPPLELPYATYITERGPFMINNELNLLKNHSIDVLVSKNSGGEASYGKIIAARELGLKVIMIARPVLPTDQTITTLEEVLALCHTYLPLL